MTQEQSLADPGAIDQDQQQMDQQQGLGEATSYLTAEQVGQLLQQQRQAILNEVRGVQGHVDRGLDAVRRDLGAQMRAQAQAAERNQKIENLMAEVPEENREWAARLIRETYGAQAPVTPTPPQTEADDAEALKVLARLAEDVQAMGLDPRNPGLDYQAVLRGDRPAFLASLGTVARAGGQGGTPRASASSTPPPAAPAAVPVNPSPRATPPSGTGFRTFDDAQAAFIEGRINLERYRAEGDRFGQVI